MLSCCGHFTLASLKNNHSWHTEKYNTLLTSVSAWHLKNCFWLHGVPVSSCLISRTTAAVVFATADSCSEAASLPGLASQRHAKIVSLPANRDDRYTSLHWILVFLSGWARALRTHALIRGARLCSCLFVALGGLLVKEWLQLEMSANLMTELMNDLPRGSCCLRQIVACKFRLLVSKIQGMCNDTVSLQKLAVLLLIIAPHSKQLIVDVLPGYLML